MLVTFQATNFILGSVYLVNHTSQDTTPNIFQHTTPSTLIFFFQLVSQQFTKNNSAGRLPRQEATAHNRTQNFICILTCKISLFLVCKVFTFCNFLTNFVKQLMPLHKCNVTSPMHLYVVQHDPFHSRCTLEGQFQGTTLSLIHSDS